ncbi:anthranilate synthase component I family protein [Solitalea sp. MAHUQ-68]|uniref:Anthranilate synthase component I family protein n=1 Tax=Solitalea agri TaxID=2953739 RepID=A0A9X2F1A1_9SPHI|nr:anthranilate synthase component I family protein [Solitalea agri]MCO4292235.1 anthranilate synthase component I family protein [Solitalea agri]
MFKTENINLFKEKALYWASSFNACCYLDSNGYDDAYGSYDCLIAAGTQNELLASNNYYLEELKEFQTRNRQWLFGYLSYDLKNQVEDLKSENSDQLNFPIAYFFVPKFIICIKDQDIQIISNDDTISADTIIKKIESFDLPNSTNFNPVSIKAKISKQQYLDRVEKIKKHIIRGDIYELNFCQEFYSESTEIDPVATWMKLNKRSPMPFSSFFKLNDKYILCASPERFLVKKEQKLYSQPIKGTAPTSDNPEENEALKSALKNDLKERSENVMIVDLVRNDLTRCAEPASVQVEELFGIYSFKQVHQMISTVSATLNHNLDFSDAIKYCFPMGSMTGAPKIRAMEIIEDLEESKRGVYSGALGYITPNCDFDLNVVIRSILYDQKSQYLSFQVGGAITYQSVAEKEYNECLLKAKAIMETLGISGI